MDVKLKLVQMLFFALVILGVFNNLGDNFAGIQNRNGVLFFMASMSGFNSIQGSIGQFSSERPVFIRERLSNTYGVGSYFLAKCTAELPFIILIPIIFVSIIYFIIGLNDSSANRFFVLALIHIMTWFSGAGYGLCVSTFVPRMEVAMAFIPILVVPFMIFAGFFINPQNIPVYYYEFEYTSLFKYNYQAAVQNEFTDLQLYCMQQIPPCDPLAQSGFNESITLCIVSLAIIGVVVRVIALIGLRLVSSPKKPKITRTKELAN